MKASIREAVPIAPPAAISGLSLAGINLQEWVYLVTFFYTVLLIIRIVPKIISEYRGKEEA